MSATERATRRRALQESVAASIRGEFPGLRMEVARKVADRIASVAMEALDENDKEIFRLEAKVRELSLPKPRPKKSTVMKSARRVVALLEKMDV